MFFYPHVTNNNLPDEVMNKSIPYIAFDFITHKSIPYIVCDVFYNFV